MSDNSLSPLAVSVNAEVGAGSSDKLIDAVVDTLSPATEFLGMLGDAVRLARVGIAAKITRSAKKIADDSGLVLTAPPLKFLVPFYEKASLEDEDSPELIEMWAHLLVSAGSLYKDRMMRFTSILSELGSAQAKLFDAIAHNYGSVITEIDDAALFYNLQVMALHGQIKVLAGRLARMQSTKSPHTSASLVYV